MKDEPTKADAYLGRGFDYRRIRQFKPWGAKQEWPVLNPKPPDDPNRYVYISERFINRTIIRRT